MTRLLLIILILLGLLLIGMGAGPALAQETAVLGPLWYWDGSAIVPRIAGPVQVGTTVAGQNVAIRATEGANIVTNGTFDSDLTGWAGANWAQSAGTALHTAGATTKLSQAAATVVSGTTYKLTFDVVGGTTGTVTPSFGGLTGTARNFGSASYTQYGTTSATTALAFAPTTTFDGALDNVVLVALTNATGDADIYGNLRVYSPIQSPDGTDTITLAGGKVGIGTTTPTGKLQIGVFDSPLPANTQLAIHGGGSGTGVFRIVGGGFFGDGAVNYGSYIKGGYSSSSFMSLGTRDGSADTDGLTVRSGNVGITTLPATKLDQAQFSADALGSYHTFSKSRHATQGLHTIVQDNDMLGGIQGAASDGTDFGTIPARIHFEVDDAAPAASSIGGAIVWSTAPGLAADDLTERLRIAGNGSVVLTPGTTGGLYTHAMEATAAVTANHTITITLSVPSGAKLLGAQLRVDAALAAGETWNAQYVGGAAQSIATAQTVAVNTKVSTFFDVNAATDITSDVTNITIQRSSNPGVDAFTAQGTIRAIVYYQAFTAMANAS